MESRDSSPMTAAVRGAVFSSWALGLAGLAARAVAPAPVAEAPGRAVAVGFLLGGTGLLLAAARRAQPAKVLGGLVAACGLLALVEHGVFGDESTLHTLLEGIGLVLVGAAVGRLGGEATRARGAVISGFLGAATAALSLGLLSGHFLEAALAGAGGSLLPLWSFGGLTVLGAGIVALASREAGPELRARSPRGLAIAVATFLAVGALGLWQATRTLEERRLQGLAPDELTLLPAVTLAVSVAIAGLVGFAIDQAGAAGYRERKFRAFVEAAPHAWVTVDGAGRIVQVNERAEALFGYDRDELVGETVEILVPERFQGVHPHHRGEYALDPRPRPMGAGRILHARRKDGSEVPVEISLSPVVTDEGLLVLTAAIDVSSRIEIARELTSMNEKLERQVAERTEALERRARELEEANAELERFNRLAVGREHRMIALKREVNEMAARLAEDPKYDLDFLR